MDGCSTQPQSAAAPAAAAPAAAPAAAAAAEDTASSSSRGKGCGVTTAAATTATATATTATATTATATTTTTATATTAAGGGKMNSEEAAAAGGGCVGGNNSSSSSRTAAVRGGQVLLQHQRGNVVVASLPVSATIEDNNPTTSSTTTTTTTTPHTTTTTSTSTTAGAASRMNNSSSSSNNARSTAAAGGNPPSSTAAGTAGIHQPQQQQQRGGGNAWYQQQQQQQQSSSSSSSNITTAAAGGSGAVMPCDEEVKKAFTKEWQALEHESLSSADYYFNSYAHFGIHEEMLKDTVRTGCYQRAICQNSHLFGGKIVLDVGSGTGILSLFAARAGAAHVYGIECSEIIHTARKIVDANGYHSQITFIQGKAEDVELPVEKVDIIISEWMGYFLLYESMLDTVLYCRDRWLAPGGMIFPDKSALYIAAIEDADYKKLDLKTCTKEDLDFCAPYQLTLRRKDFLHAFIAWFDVCFCDCHKPVVLSTSPHARYTHWKQTVFYMQDVVVAEAGDKVEGLIAVKKSKKNPRDLDIKLSYNFRSKSAPHKLISNTQFYRLR